MAGKTVAAERRGYEIVSTEGPFAATLTGHQRMTCGIHLMETNEGLLLAPVRNKTSKFAQDSMLNKTTTELASLAFIEKYLEDLIVKQFTHSWLSICHIQRSRHYFLRTLSVIQPTLAARTLLEKRHITAKLSGDFLNVWQCQEIPKYTLKQSSNCYTHIPIHYELHNHTHDVFLSTTECEIVSQAFPVPCATANVQYLQGTHGHTYKWDGMNITPITLHSSDIILLTAFPKRKKIQLQLSLIDKPQLDDLENLIQLQEVQSSVQALSKFFEIITIGEEHIDPQKVKDLGINAGIGSVAFVKMLLRNTIGAFLPSSWLIYTMFG